VAGTAPIDPVDNRGSVIEPRAIGWLRQQTHSLAGGLYFAAAAKARTEIVVVLSRPRSFAAHQEAFCPRGTSEPRPPGLRG